MNYDWLDGYALAKPGAAEEFKVAWDALLYRVGDRMYGMKGCYKDGRPLLSVKVAPLESERLRQTYPDKIIPGYYSDKRNWVSIFLDVELPREVVEKLVDDSYSLVFAKLTRKKQKEILGE
jgi:predicted DNA-binding protein (MmcQ/YjbR family)